LKKPLVFAEFGKSNKDPRYSTCVMDSFLNTVYTSIYNFARTGGIIGGGLVWQILAEGMNLYYDGYEIISSQNPSTSSVIAQQSHKMTTLQHIEKVEIDGVGDGLFAKVRCAMEDTFETGPQSSSHEALLFAAGATVQLVLLEASS
jgi:mannan endo-1,4-beta-mannosidase